MRVGVLFVIVYGQCVCGYVLVGCVWVDMREREREGAHFLATDPPQRPQVCRFDAEMTLMAADNEKKSFRNKKIMGSAENRRKRRRRQICRPSDETQTLLNGKIFYLLMLQNLPGLAKAANLRKL